MSRRAWSDMSGVELKARRLRMGYSLQDFGADLNVRPGTVEDWEAGKRPIPEGVETDLEHLENGFEELMNEAIFFSSWDSEEQETTLFLRVDASRTEMVAAAWAALTMKKQVPDRTYRIVRDKPKE